MNKRKLFNLDPNKTVTRFIDKASLWHFWLFMCLLVLVPCRIVADSLSSDASNYLSVVIVGPVVAGTGLATLLYYISGYSQVINESYIKRAVRSRVALTVVMSSDGHILMNRQLEEPHRGKWVFLGGYSRRGETLEQTALRRIWELVGIQLDLVVDEVLAQSRNDQHFGGFVDSHYSMLALPVTIFYARTSEGALVSRELVPSKNINLRWWSVKEIELDQGYRIPDYLREVILVKAKKAGESQLWKLNRVEFPEAAYQMLENNKTEEPKSLAAQT